jgi:23S rRNA (guanosine2251-2'-O)-methyltransferase
LKPKNSNRWVIGQHAVTEALRKNPQWAVELNVLENQKDDSSEVLKICQKNKISIKEKGRKFFDATFAEGHQGLALSMNGRVRWNEESAQNQNSLVVFLDGITDPHNLGAILRTSWLLGVHGVFIPKNRAVDLTPIVCKVASGGAEHVPVEACHFQSQLEWFKKQGYWVYGLSEKGEQILPQIKLADKVVLIVGAEGKGLRSSTETFCDQFVRIPQVESGSSYNASVAFSISAYECSRQKFL